MIELNKISILDWPFQNIKLVGTVLFEEFGTTVIYSDNSNSVIVKEWVDCSSDGRIDRYFYYTTTKGDLKNFLTRNITHAELIKNALRGILFFEEVESARVLKRYLVYSDDLPAQYSPANDYLINEADVVDLEQIFNYFELYSFDENIVHQEQVRKLAEDNLSETFDIHIYEGFGVRHGTIESGTLSKVLNSFDHFYKEVSLDSIRGKGRGKLNLNAKGKSPDRVKLLELCSTVVYSKMAASFSLLVRPMSTALSEWNEVSISASIAHNMFLLLESSLSSDLLNEEVKKSSPYTINAYKDFVNALYDNGIAIDLDWYNPIKKIEKRFEFSRGNSLNILENIKNLSIISTASVEAIGKFRALNLNSGNFTFVTDLGDQYSGYIENERRDGMYSINFISDFKVVIDVTISLVPGKKEPVQTAIMSSYFVSRE